MGHTLSDIEEFVMDPKFRNWVLRPDPELNHYWEQWQESNPDKKEIVDQARALIMAASPDAPWISALNREKLWQRIKGAEELNKKTIGPGTTIHPISSEVGSRYQPVGKYRRAVVVKFAAVILFFMAVSYFLFFQAKTIESPGSATELIIKTNPRGQKSRIFLPDGSVLHLNAGSTIEYPAAFGTSDRTVNLTGEAYFEVRRDSLRPFIVVTGQLITKALGTSFNINAFENNDQIVVALLSGVVEVSAGSDKTAPPLFLYPGESVEYTTGPRTLTKTNFRPEDVVAWKNGTMIFQDTPVEQVIHRLENWYGVKIEVVGLRDSSLAITTTFNNATLDNVLQNLGFIWDFEHKIQDKKITIIFN
jgi:ferric-dicitrate binding protein FerR (iron transport regulator)